VSATALLLPVPTPTLSPFSNLKHAQRALWQRILFGGVLGHLQTRERHCRRIQLRELTAHSTFYFLPPFLFEYKSILIIILDQTFLNLTIFIEKSIKIYDIKLVSLDVL